MKTGDSGAGGRARAARMTAKERSDAARHAVQARWSKQKCPPVVVVRVITGPELALSDGRWL